MAYLHCIITIFNVIPACVPPYRNSWWFKKHLVTHTSTVEIRENGIIPTLPCQLRHQTQQFFSNLYCRQTHSCCAHTMFLKRHTFQTSHPVDHMKISTHPEEPLHFLRPTRPTVHCLCGHYFIRKKAQLLMILPRSNLGEGGGMETSVWPKCRPLFSGYTLSIIWGSWNRITLVKQKLESLQVSVFFADNVRTVGIILNEFSLKEWLLQRAFKNPMVRCEWRGRRMCWPHIIHPHTSSNHCSTAGWLTNPGKLSQSLWLVSWSWGKSS